MVEVRIESIRVSLISQQRIIVLREVDGDVQVPIWIGPYETEAISINLEETELARPMTHDLLKNSIEALGGVVTQVIISDLRGGVYYAEIHVERDGETIVIDSRPSDAIATGVRCKVPLFVADIVIDTAGVLPAADIRDDSAEEDIDESDDDESLDAFKNFFD